MAKKNEDIVTLDNAKETTLNVELIGSGDLILNKKARSYELSEVFKQTHPKGTKMPAKFAQDYNLWEHLVTSITWDKPIEYFDDDYSKYTEEYWSDLMQNNHPCILSYGLVRAMAEAFKTFGFKDTTGKAGTDFTRAINFLSPKFPITFASVTYEQKLVPSQAMGHPNVVAQYNVFHGWKCNVTLACADVVFPAETIIDLLATTGKYIGIGTQRKNGYGHWTLGDIQQINVK